MNSLKSEKEPNNEILDSNQHINSKYKLVCTKEGIQISMLSSDLLDLSFKSETISYDDKRINGLRISIESIKPDVENGKFIFYASEIMFEPSVIKRSNINSKEEKIIVFGNEEIKWNIKRDLLTIPAQWLVDNGFIKKENMAVEDFSKFKGRGNLTLLNKVPEHLDNPDSVEFVSSKKLADDIYLFKNYSGRNCKRNGEYLMKRFAPNVKYSILGYDEA